jgi:hypothetical protein
MVMDTGITASSVTGPLFAPPSIAVDKADDGSLLLRSTEPLAGYPLTVVHSVRAWAAADPGRPLAAERDADGQWRICGYGAAVTAADALGQALLDRGLSPSRPLLAEPIPPAVIVAGQTGGRPASAGRSTTARSG